MEEFLQQYGYIILAVSLVGKSFPVLGSFFSSSTVLYLSGLFAGTGEFEYSIVLLVGLVAVSFGDSSMFLAGKYFNEKFPKLQKAQDDVQAWLDKVHRGDNRLAYFYMFSGFLRAYLPFLLGYSKMENTKWFRKVIAGALLFVPTISILGYSVGRLDVSGGTKAVISGFMYVLSMLLFTKLSHEIYKESSIDIKSLAKNIKLR